MVTSAAPGCDAPGKPPTPVTVRIGPVALNRSARRSSAADDRASLPAPCKHRPIQLRTTAPVAVELHVGDLGARHRLRASDTREFGAQFSGSFKPSR